jgi:hypothetical protein
MKLANKDLSLVPEVDWARLAAFIDGEGHIRVVSKVVKARGYRQDYVEVIVGNTDPRLSVWLKDLFGGSIPKPSASTSRCKVMYRWTIACAAAARVLQGCLPYFIIKRDQAEIALAFHSTLKRRGVKGTPDFVRASRADLKSKLHVLTARGPQPAAVNE